MTKVIAALRAVFRGFVEAAGILLFAVFMLAVLVGSFVWWLMPWHQRKVREEAERMARKQIQEERERRLNAEKALLEANAKAAEGAIKQRAEEALAEDPVAVANELIVAAGRRG